MEHILDFVTVVHRDDLHGYAGRDVEKILLLLSHRYGETNHSEAGTRHKRHVGFNNMADMLSLQLLPSLHEVLEQVALSGSAVQNEQIRSTNGEKVEPSSGMYTPDAPTDTLAYLHENYLTTTLRLLEENIRLRADIAELHNGLQTSNSESAVDINNNGDRFMQDEPKDRQKRETEEWSGDHIRDENSHNLPKHVVTNTQRITPDSHQTHPLSTGKFNGTDGTNDSIPWWEDESDGHGDMSNAHLNAQRLHEIAHILHYCSIAILGIFVAQVGVYLTCT